MKVTHTTQLNGKPYAEILIVEVDNKFYGVSEKEEIKAGDKIHNIGGFLAECVESDSYMHHKTAANIEGNNYPHYYKKLLIHPEQFPTDFTLKAGDKLWVECEPDTYGNKYRLQTSGSRIKLTSNQVTLYRAEEQSEKAELISMLDRCEKTFGIIDKIIVALKAADRSDLSDLVNGIDIDLPLTQAKIKDLIHKIK